MLAYLVLGEGPLPASQMAVISLCVHLTSSLCTQRETDSRPTERQTERVRPLVMTPLLMRTPIPFWGSSPHLNLITPKGLTSSYHHMRVKASTYEFGGDTDIQCITARLLGRENCKSPFSGSSYLLEKPVISRLILKRRKEANIYPTPAMCQALI